MADPIVSRIQNIQERIKEIENFGKTRPPVPATATDTRKSGESFSQIMKEINTLKSVDNLTNDRTASEPFTREGNSLNNFALNTLSNYTKSNAVLSFDEIVKQASQEHQIDVNLIHAIIKAESNYDPKAVSHKGAQGLMQLMPQTAKELGVNDSFDPSQNIFGGTRYIKEMLERYQGDLVKALAAYNAGPTAVDKAKGLPNIAETQLYVPKVLKTYYQLNQED